MISASTSALAFVAIILTLLIYLIAARVGRRIRIEHPDDFFLARNRFSSDDFGDCQIAYALQMSTVYPFFVLAAAGSWLVPMVNSVFWFFGILLLYRWIPRFGPFLGRSTTIHAFLADINGTPIARQVASALTVIGFSGVIIFEVVFGASVFRVLFGNPVIYYLVISLLAAYVTSYIWSGGQTATLRTDQFQLVVAYLGLHLSVAFLFATHRVDVVSLKLPVIPILVLVMSLFMIWFRVSSLRRTIRARRHIASLAYTIILLSLLGMMISLSRAEGVFAAKGLLSGWIAAFSGNRLEVALMLSTAALIPIFWQFVDLSNWQRICSLTAQKEEDYRKGTRAGLAEYLVESPLSWLLPLLLGLAVPIVKPELLVTGDPFDNFLQYLLGSPGLGAVVGIVLCAGIVGVFMSTADAGITAVAYAFAYDLWAPTRRIMDRGSPSADETEQVVRAGRWFMVCLVGLVVVLFVFMDWFFQAGPIFLGLLFAFYTPMVAFSPAVVGPIVWRRRPHRVFVITAMSSGAFAGIALGVTSTLSRPDLQWYPAPAAFLISWLVYIAGLALRSYPVPDARKGGTSRE